MAEVSRFESRWQSEATEVAAAEFVGAALIAGLPDRAVAAAGELAESVQPMYRMVGEAIGHPDERLLDSPPSVPEFDPERVTASFYRKIAEAKQRVRRDPRNAIAWSDLARRYTALGELSRARQALSVARALAPNSRYLIRSEVRFLVHVGRHDEAIRVLERSPRTRDDPWLMATRLSVSATAGLPISGVRAARRILERGNFRPIELSELESELGTLELRDGTERRARALFQRSLDSPTDNSLAQATWASHRMASLDVDVGTIAVPFAAEAMSRSAAESGDWSTALSHAIQWLDDQPFDTQAAITASYLAAVGLDDWPLCRDLADMGLRANPTDLTLINNLSYSLIEMGDLDSASKWLGLANFDADSSPEQVALDATRGLLMLRLGELDVGRKLYRRAIDRARRDRDGRSEAMARSMLLREEIRIGGLDLAAAFEPIAELGQRVRDPDVQRCIDRTVRFAALVGYRFARS